MFAYLPYDLQLIIIDLMYYAYLSFQIKLTTHDYKGKLSMKINFKCTMPKLMKGATPNELVKGVTANLMSIIGQVSEPA
ncbi:putative integral membrane protein, PqiA family [Trichinella spiralis]|nr:putative integral membrane protein, PqiA family [Trichinella spiralis]